MIHATACILAHAYKLTFSTIAVTWSFLMKTSKRGAIRQQCEASSMCGWCNLYMSRQHLKFSWLVQGDSIRRTEILIKHKVFSHWLQRFARMVRWMVWLCRWRVHHLVNDGGLCSKLSYRNGGPASIFVPHAALCYRRWCFDRITEAQRRVPGILSTSAKNVKINPSMLLKDDLSSNICDPPYYRHLKMLQRIISG